MRSSAKLAIESSPCSSCDSDSSGLVAFRLGALAADRSPHSSARTRPCSTTKKPRRRRTTSPPSLFLIHRKGHHDRVLANITTTRLEAASGGKLDRTQIRTRESNEPIRPRQNGHQEGEARDGSEDQAEDEERNEEVAGNLDKRQLWEPAITTSSTDDDVLMKEMMRYLHVQKIVLLSSSSSLLLSNVVVRSSRRSNSSLVFSSA